ncbi:MAG TPA: metallopeptidase TldD-related protein [Pseudolabrys sp.]|nr:metallopeptidase TldD-related protein [Pseudolabrys sp.]
MDPAMSSLIDRAGLDRDKVRTLIGRGLEGADDGELFLEYRQAEVLVFDNGRLKQATYDTAQGFGLRAVKDEAVGYAHASDLSEAALARAAEAVRAVKGGHTGKYADAPGRTNRKLYADDNPLGQPAFDAKVKLLEEIDAYARAKDPRVRQVSASIAATWQVVEIVRADGEIYRDIRPLVRLNVSVVTGDGDRQESGSFGFGGREGYERFITTHSWQGAVDEAVRQSLVNLDAVPAPAGEMDVVLGSGWPGVMLHEAIGHGLEGDFNRKKTSAFAGLMGQQVAAKGVTVVDDGTMQQRRGSLSIDDEGTPTNRTVLIDDGILVGYMQDRQNARLMGQRVAAKGVTVVDDGTMQQRRGSLSIDDEGTPTNRTVLIEDGILVGYMQDRQNARLMGMKPTGNGRRESHAHVPMPRMTNTYMLAGQHDPQEIIASVKNGLYAVSFGGGQVDITSGKYVFQCTEAYKIENGKVGAPVKGAMLIGNGPTDLHRITMIGNDFALDPGIGTCGKNGQGVPVGVGQPSLRMDRITVGGTA